MSQNSFCRQGLDSKLQHCGPCNISWKTSKKLYLDCSGHIEGDVIQIHQRKEKEKKEGEISKNLRLYVRNKLVS
jgi:hypothetical protein